MGRKRGVQYRGGSFYRSDDRSGFTRRAEDTAKEWNESIVGTNLWEARQPQDLVQGTPDDQSVPEARPVPPAAFVGPISTDLALPAAVGDTFLYLEAINGFSAGMQIGVMLDTDGYFNTRVNGAPTVAGIHITTALPYFASKGNVVTVYQAAPGIFP